jgi:hypothetical protein
MKDTRALDTVQHLNQTQPGIILSSDIEVKLVRDLMFKRIVNKR